MYHGARVSFYAEFYTTVTLIPQAIPVLSAFVMVIRAA